LVWSRPKNLTSGRTPRSGPVLHRCHIGLRRSPRAFWSGLALSAFPLVIYGAAFAIAGVSTGASLAVYASAPVLYFITITLLRRLAPSGSAERQFT
jgi:hypothetical protein